MSFFSEWVPDRDDYLLPGASDMGQRVHRPIGNRRHPSPLILYAVHGVISVLLPGMFTIN